MKWAVPSNTRIVLRQLISIAIGGAAGTLTSYFQTLMQANSASQPDLKVVLLHAMAGAGLAVAMHWMPKPNSLVAPVDPPKE